MISAKKIATATASAGVALLSFASVTFADTLTIEGNGPDSVNKIYNYQKCLVGVSQSNSTYAYTSVTAVANSGGNSAIGNNGDVSIMSGDASTAVGVMVSGGSNTAEVPSCCDCAGETVVDISGNGPDSYNKVQNAESSKSLYSQKSKTKATTRVKALSNSGKNKALWNNGETTEIVSGVSETGVGVEVVGGNNELN